VIGGGITGAGIALDAASRGIKTALVEKGDFAVGTSSRSTKLIHGGLRYLKQGEIALVTEVGRERAILYRNAPHLVVPEKMLLPLVKNGNYGKFATSLGLWVYDLLAGVKKEERRKMLSKEQTLEREPLLRNDILRGGCLYAEYRTDDARLTIEVIKTAANHGAACINYAEAKNFIYENGELVEVECHDLLSQQDFTIRARQTVNAAGPWVDILRKRDNSLHHQTLSAPEYPGRMVEGSGGGLEFPRVGSPPGCLARWHSPPSGGAGGGLGGSLHLTKGVHLVIPHEKLPVKQALYFDATDGRMVFAIPRGKVTYIGTTDTDYSGNLEDPATTEDDANYLLDSVKSMFPSIQLSLSDVVSSWAGLRPLIHEEGKSPSELSRKDEIFISHSGLISIAGGKLTGYRKMAQRVVDLVNKNLCKSHEFPRLDCKTENIVINGGEIEKIADYIRQVFEKINDNGLGSYEAEYLVRTYGKQTDIILEKFYEFNKDTTPKIALARAELWFTVNNESVFHLKDFFIRRTGKLYFDIQAIEELIPPLLQDMKNYFSWTEDQCKTEKAALEKAMRAAKNFYR